MTRSKDHAYPRHEKHVARNGHTEARYGVKKMGAGIANWGVLGDEIDNVQEVARSEVETIKVSSKLHLVDSETFQNMRTEQES
ncbi:unnamed protein product [Mucor hiemalis]